MRNLLPEDVVFIFTLWSSWMSDKWFTVLGQTRIPASDRNILDEVLIFQRAAGKWHVLLEFMFNVNSWKAWPAWFHKGFYHVRFFGLILSSKRWCNPTMMCAFGVVSSFWCFICMYPDKCIMLLKVLNFRLPLIIRQEVTERENLHW